MTTMLRWLERKKRPDAERGRRVCTDCGSNQLWPSGLRRDGSPFACRDCGTLVDGKYRRLALDPRSGALYADAEERAAAAELSAAELQDLGAKLVSIATGLGIATPRPTLTTYLEGVAREVGAPIRSPLVLLDAGEPLLTILPAGSIVVSLGLLASLDEESQLAFLIAREGALHAAGWPEKRFSSAHADGASWLARLRPGGSALADALALTLRVGWGAIEERRADDDAMRVVRDCGYDTRSAARALRALESASLPGRGARFVMDGERGVRQDAAAARPCPCGRINREVYRRAVGGFAVFGAR